MGIPPNHSFLLGFSTTNHPAIKGYHFRKPPYAVNRVALPLDGFRPGEVAREKNEKQIFFAEERTVNR